MYIIEQLAAFTAESPNVETSIYKAVTKKPSIRTAFLIVCDFNVPRHTRFSRLWYEFVSWTYTGISSTIPHTTGHI